MSAFENRFQAMADRDMKEISWKQFFAIICINMCKESPTVKELAEIMGRMFTGISDEQLQVTIQTIIQIEDNLKRLS